MYSHNTSLYIYLNIYTVHTHRIWYIYTLVLWLVGGSGEAYPRNPALKNTNHKKQKHLDPSDPKPSRFTITNPLVDETCDPSNSVATDTATTKSLSRYLLVTNSTFYVF